MPVIDQTDIAELEVRRVWRNRPGDNYAWWWCVVHELKGWNADCQSYNGVSVTADAVLEISRRNNGADVDVVTDNGTVEIVAWLRRKKPGEIAVTG